jgi:hypothetical protein
MTKKMMLLALAAVSAAMFAMPAVASANWGVDPVNAKFSGTSEGVGMLAAAGEPTITCEGPDHVTGAWTDGTKGSFELDATKCHIVVVGFTIECKTSGAPVGNTIKAAGTFKNVTTTTGKRGILVTPTKTTVVCGATTPIDVEGNVIGVVTSINEKACPTTWKTSVGTLKFSAEGNKQLDMTTDGEVKEYDLTAETTNGSGTKVTAALSGSFNLTIEPEATVTCNNP